MNIQDLIGGASAAVISPHDVVAISIDRYLTGAQIEVIGGHFQKKLPNTKVIILPKGMTIQVWNETSTLEAMAASVAP
jgi:hypothetical protein